MSEQPAPLWILSVPVSHPSRVEEVKEWLEEVCDACPVEVEMAEQSVIWLESYFSEEATARLIADAVRNTFSDTQPQVRLCASRDWTTFWRHHFQTRLIGENLIIVPEWLRTETDTGDRVPIWINPGLSFGTGDHFTTRYCLEALDRIHREGPMPAKLFDAGCGSAILSIAARKFGCRNILAVDFDELAIQQAQENLVLNDVPEGIDLQTMDLTRTWPTEQYPLVIANLYGGLLMELAPRLYRACTGTLVLSGIRAVESEAVSSVFAQLGAREVRSEADHEWCGVTLDCST